MSRRPDDRDTPGQGRPDRVDPTAVMPGAGDEAGGEGGRDRRVYFAPDAPAGGSRPRAPDAYAAQRTRPYDETPRMPRGEAAGYAEAPPRRPAPGSGRRMPPPGRQPTRPPRRWGRRFLAVLLVLLVLLLVAGVVLYVILDSKLQRTDALTDYEARPAGGSGQNWLIVGSDSREGLSAAERKRLGTGEAAGRRTDTVMIMHIARGGGSPTLVSLPRDSYVPIPGHGRNKLNAAFAFGGPKLLARTVEQATGLRMDHYMELGFGGFAGLVDAVDGVTMCIDKPVRDRFSGLDIRKAGCQELGSKQALAYVRARHGFATGDLARVEHQRQFISALIKKSTSPGVLFNPFKAISLANAGTAALTVDEGDHLYNLFRLALAMRALNGDKGVTTTVPVRGTGSVAGAGSVVLWDSAKASALFNALRNDDPVKGIVEK
ncbi:MAG TPA: LCP family protein [Actinomycetes bacterium]|nr:LCP family protein [Actinomycetes bacterium]